MAFLICQWQLNSVTSHFSQFFPMRVCERKLTFLLNRQENKTLISKTDLDISVTCERWKNKIPYLLFALADDASDNLKHLCISHTITQLKYVK